MQTKPTNAEAFAAELGPMFDLWAYADGRESVRADLVEAGPKEMARQFRQAEDLLEGLESAAERAVGFGAYIVLGEAKNTPPRRERSRKATCRPRAVTTGPGPRRTPALFVRRSGREMILFLPFRPMRTSPRFGYGAPNGGKGPLGPPSEPFPPLLSGRARFPSCLDAAFALPLASLPTGNLGPGPSRGPGLYHGAMKITPTRHGRKRMRERRVTVADIRSVLGNRPPMHPSPNKRVQTGRALDGRRLEVVYTEAKAGEGRIVSVVTP